MLLLGSAGALGWNAVIGAYRGPGPLAAARDVVVPHGGPEEVGRALLSAGVIGHVWQFRLAVAATSRDGVLRAAELAFPAHASLATVLDVLRRGRPVEHFVTIPEGLTAAEIEALLARTPGLTGKAPLPAEGALLPQTYAFTLGTTRRAVEARAEAAMTRALRGVWQGRDAALPLASPEQLVTLASIVERETALAAERPLVASVFLNRLRLGMRLQSDPTVIYADSAGGGTLAHPLTRADLERPSPYNTYQVDGLPPGPIDSPGLASLEAVAHPAASRDLYFVANGSGGHAFARTLAAHNRNVARWRALNGETGH